VAYSFVIRNRKFSALLAGQIISLLGDVVFGAAIAWYVLNLTGKATSISYLTIALVVPNLLFSFVAGPIVDRWDRRRIMITSSLVQFGVLLFIPALYSLGELSPVWIYLVVFVLGSASAFFIPARNAIMPQIFENKDDLTTANSIMNGCFESTRLSGYGVVAILSGILTVVGVSAVAINTATFDSVTFLVSALSILAMGSVASSLAKRRKEHSYATFRNDILEGWSYVWKNFVIRITMISSMLSNFFISIAIGFLVVYSKEALHTTFSGYALILAMNSVGTISGAFAVGKLHLRKHLGPALIASSVVAGAAVIALSPQNQLIAVPP
jgi:DHA3 family macrolide efflux protein-like MFS transporter